MKSRKIPEPVFVTVRRGGLTMRGMIHLPEGASELRKVPMVLILHGFAGNRIGAGFSNAELSRRLAAAGIASIRMDFLGSGESDGRFEDMSVFTELADAEAILKYVKKQPFVDLHRIAVPTLIIHGSVTEEMAAKAAAQFNAHRPRSQQIAQWKLRSEPLPRTATGKLQRWILEKEEEAK